MAVDLITLKGYLLEAELALHKLQTGTKEMSVSYEGKSVTFNDTSTRGESGIYRLIAYIASLKQQIAALEGTFVPRGPIHFSF